MTKQERAMMYKTFLAEEGYGPKIDGDGDVSFKFEGGNYVIVIPEQDEMFFNLIYPAFWPIESEAERAKVVIASLYATSQTKVAKVFPIKDNTWAAIEMFCSPPQVFKAVFQRSLSALRAAVKNFSSKMQE